MIDPSDETRVRGRRYDEQVGQLVALSGVQIGMAIVAVAVFGLLWVSGGKYGGIPFRFAIRGSGGLIVIPGWPYLVAWYVSTKSLVRSNWSVWPYLIAFSTISVGGILFTIIHLRHFHSIGPILGITVVQYILFFIASILLLPRDTKVE